MADDIDDVEDGEAWAREVLRGVWTLAELDAKRREVLDAGRGMARPATVRAFVGRLDAAIDVAAERGAVELEEGAPVDADRSAV